MSQINFAYGFATKGQQQGHIHLLGASGFVKQQLRGQMPHLDSWAVTVDDRPFATYFQV